MLLGSGTREVNVEELSKELLKNFQSLGGLFTLPPSLLIRQKGIGKAKAAVISAVSELIFRIKLNELKKRQVNELEFLDMIRILYLKSSKEVRECFYLIALDQDMSLIEIEQIARGSLDEVGVHPRDLVKFLLDCGAKYAIISHNHPGGFSTPSEKDLELYTILNGLFFKLEIELLDQWIIGKDGIYSCDQKRLLDL